MKNTKYCKTCLEEKPILQFHVESKNMDGRSSKCKKCKANAVKSMSYTSPNFQPPPTAREIMLKRHLDSINMTEEEYMCKSVPDQNKINFEAKICNI